MKNHTILFLLATASLAVGQTRTVTVDANANLVHPRPVPFAAANDLPRLSGNNTFSGSNDFNALRSGDLRYEEARDELFSITVNGSAADMVASGVQLYTDFGNTISVVEENGSYFWSDENSWWMFGRSASWSTAEEGAAALRSLIPGLDPGWNGQYPYAVSGAGSTCAVNVSGTDVADWSSNSGQLLPVVVNQQGRNAGWMGAGTLISPDGNITFSGSLNALNAPAAPPLLITDSDASTPVTENWNAQGFAMSGQSYPLIGMWTSPGQQSMAIGFGGRPATNGDNLGARPWHAVNSSYVGRMTYLGSEGNFDIQSTPANTWELGDWSLMRSWAFLYAGSFVAGDSTPGGFSSRLIYFDGVEPASKNPGAYYWRPLSAAMWNADIGTNKRELRVKFFGAPAGGYGNRDALATRVIASTEWTTSRWRGTGTSDPSSPQDGDLFFRSDTSKVRIYASGSWRDLN
jgi:hypothetical protein